jgi:hypothetical protein
MIKFNFFLDKSKKILVKSLDISIKSNFSLDKSKKTLDIFHFLPSYHYIPPKKSWWKTPKFCRKKTSTSKAAENSERKLPT